MLEYMTGVIIGMLIGILLVFYVGIAPHIDECEKELPRNERCIIIAVPEVE